MPQIRLAALFLFLVTAWAFADEEMAHTAFTERQDVQDYISQVSQEHGFDRAYLQNLFAGVNLQPVILGYFDRPSTSRPWFQFKPDFVNARRIKIGARFLREQHGLMQRIEREYGVEGEYVAAIMTAETMMGQQTGRFRIMDVLSTTAFEYPRRADYFKQELTQFLLLSREEGRDPYVFRGSYAGAMGWGQFMPTSYRKYAVDADGDHHRDIWSNPADAAASVANFLKQHGWQYQTLLSMPVTVSGESWRPLLEEKLSMDRTVSDLEGQGIQFPPGLDRRTPTLLFSLQNVEAAEYWAGFNNFYVLTRYNRSVHYAMAVQQLAEQIRKAADNPDFEVMESQPRTQDKLPAKKKASRPVKSKTGKKHK